MGPTTIPIHQTTTSSSPGHHQSVSTAAHTHSLDLHSLSRYGQEGAQGSAREGSHASVERRRSGELGEIEVHGGSAGQRCFYELGSSARSAALRRARRRAPAVRASHGGAPTKVHAGEPRARGLAIVPSWPEARRVGCCLLDGASGLGAAPRGQG
jgi:hypothetical protein